VPGRTICEGPVCGLDVCEVSGRGKDGTDVGRPNPPPCWSTLALPPPPSCVLGLASGVVSRCSEEGRPTASASRACDEKVANRDTKVWHLVIENGY
jgi:hypothetical protein